MSGRERKIEPISIRKNGRDGIGMGRAVQRRFNRQMALPGASATKLECKRLRINKNVNDLAQSSPEAGRTLG